MRSGFFGFLGHFSFTPWSPILLFANGEQGVWFDPSDLSTLFQDAEGTIPVTTDGDPVGLMLDKSGNDGHASQSISARRPIYRNVGGISWLKFDGVDDRLEFTAVNAQTVFFATDDSGTSTQGLLGGGGNSGPSGYIARSTAEVRYRSNSADFQRVINGRISSIRNEPSGLTSVWSNGVQSSSVLVKQRISNIRYLSPGNISHSPMELYGVVLCVSDETSHRVDAERFLAKRSGVVI